MTFDQQLLSDYLRFESIEAVFKKYNYNLPISFASYARLLNKNKIVTTAGPNSHLSESLYFFSLLKDYGGSVSRLRKKLGISISTQTLHRILHSARIGVTRRFGTALILEDINQKGFYLFGQDMSLVGKLGKKGDWSLPMGHTREQDSHYTSVLRVLQREVFANEAIFGTFPFELLNQNLNPLFSIDITDIRVDVYRLYIDLTKYSFSSFKLANHRFVSTNEINNLQMRPGLKDIIQNFKRFGSKENIVSSLNSSLLESYMIK